MRFKSCRRQPLIEALENRQLLSIASMVTGPVATELENAIKFAQGQLTLTESSDLDNNPNSYPNYTLPSGAWSTTGAGTWSSGAFPSSLWEMYLLTGNATWKTQALEWSAPLAAEDTQTADTYLQVYDPFIYDYQQTGSTQAASYIISSAQARLSNFNPTVGAWQTTWRASTSGNPLANFGVLLDESMDAQEVYWAAQQTGNTAWFNDASDEMTTVEKYLVRPDGSTAQWGYFNATTGQFIDQETFAGYSAASTWSRGQAWAIDSFTTAYSYTHRADFLATAENVANYFINNLPSDFVPYWDFDAAGIPNTYRDSSAAAIAAAGLLQLAKIDPNAANAQRYYLAAQSILGSLAASPYLAEGTSSHGILTQAAGQVPPPGPIAVDASLVYGDYYFLLAADLYLTQTPAAVSISPAAPTLLSGTAQQFTANVTDQYDRPMTAPPTLTWSDSGGTISTAGVYTAPNTAGTYLVSATGGGVTGSTSVAVNDFGAGEDIGSVGQTGSDSFAAASGSYTVSGGGADIWNNSDAFHFVSRAVSGNLTMTAQVQNLTNTNPWAKAGLMVRASAAADSQFVDIVVTPGQGISFQWRSGTGGSCGDVQVIKVGASVYLEITRSGNSFAGFYSTDDIHWTQVGSAVTIAMAANTLAGLAVTAHNNAALCTATFDQVMLSPALYLPASTTVASPPSKA